MSLPRNTTEGGASRLPLADLIAAGERGETPLTLMVYELPAGSVLQDDSGGLALIITNLLRPDDRCAVDMDCVYVLVRASALQDLQAIGRRIVAKMLEAGVLALHEPLRLGVHDEPAHWQRARELLPK